MASARNTNLVQALNSISPQKKRSFNRLLLRWCAKEDSLRTYPWRETADPYRLLIAELLLRRTNAPSVVPVYTAFIRKYPDLSSFCNATPNDLQDIMSPLGLQWRTENIIELASFLANRSRKSIPESIKELMELPGVGPYVARAVIVNSRNVTLIPVDTNVLRVLGRFFGIALSDKFRRNPIFQSFADSLIKSIEHQQAREFNFALLDVASKFCRASIPKCDYCPLVSTCKFPEQKRKEKTKP